MIACRWRLVEHWLPCAIGGVPSAHDPNGASAALPHQGAAHVDDTVDSTATAAEQQEGLAAAAPDCFAKFEIAQVPGAAAAEWGGLQQDAVANQLASISPTDIVVW